MPHSEMKLSERMPLIHITHPPLIRPVWPLPLEANQHASFKMEPGPANPHVNKQATDLTVFYECTYADGQHRIRWRKDTKKLKKLKAS